MTNAKPQPGKPAKPVFMKCKNPKCDSIQVVEITYAPGTRLYRCIKCSTPHPVQVGGKMDLRSIWALASIRTLERKLQREKPPSVIHRFLVDKPSVAPAISDE